MIRIRSTALVLAAALLTLTAGCGETGKGINKGKDRPVPPPEKQMGAVYSPQTSPSTSSAT